MKRPPVLPAASSDSSVPSAPSVPAAYAISPAVTLNPFAARALHDAEDVAFGPRRLRESVPVLPQRFRKCRTS
ncbi:hypothetical protein [Streptomyces sp. NPDC053427]|uniref:hypothetical protein n=1 Tax=Streptomyces sp. NPDC053427 TaxID=3365701 RepID=UPI0037D101D9